MRPQFGCTLEFITNKSQEGSQFCRGFGGIGGILRYSVDPTLNEARRPEPLASFRSYWSPRVSPAVVEWSCQRPRPLLWVDVAASLLCRTNALSATQCAPSA